MPRRTNVFQKLILLLNEQLLDKASVIESAELRDAVTGKLREVDILIQGNIGDYAATIAVECIDSGRKADSTWVEGMSKKHEHLPTDKLVLVSRSGFYKPAYEKAEHCNIEALSLEAAENSDWPAKMHTVQINTWHLEIVSHQFQLIDRVPEKRIRRLVFCDPHGNQHNLIQLLKSDVVSNLELTKELHKLLSERDETHDMLLSIDITTGKFRDWYIPDDEGNKHKIHWYGMYVRVEQVDVSGKIERAVFRGKKVAYATLSDDFEDTVLTFAEGAEGLKIRSGIVPHKSKSGKNLLARYQIINNQPLRIQIEESESKR